MFNYFLELYDKLVSYLQSDNFVRTLFWIKVTSSGISSLLIAAIVILLSRSHATLWISEGMDSFKKVNLPERMERSWQKIQERLKKEDEANLKLAVIEADSILDEILKRMGLGGKDMGERLEQMPKDQLKALEDVWDAHRLRNLIVHQPAAIVTKAQAEKAVSAYQNALKELEVI